jgi:hypothetical protein
MVVKAVDIDVKRTESREQKKDFKEICLLRRCMQRLNRQVFVNARDWFISR